MDLSQVFTHYPQTNFSETFESESTLVNEYTIQEMTLQANQTQPSQSESKLRYRSKIFFQLATRRRQRASTKINLLKVNLYLQVHQKKPKQSSL